MIGLYYKTIFKNQCTGETKFLITPTEPCQEAKDGLLLCHGKIGFYVKNIPIYIDGSFDGEEFQVTNDYIPSDPKEHVFHILEYISNDFTDCQKEKIANACNNNIFKFVEQKDATNILLKIFAKSSKKERLAKLIINNVKKLKNKEVITKELMSYGIPINKIELLYKKDITLQKLDNNPYIIFLKFGISIDSAEMYTFKRLKITEYSIARLCGFIYDAMLYSTKLGHTCCTLEMLTKIVNMRVKHHGMYNTIFDKALVNLCVNELSEHMSMKIINDIPYIYFNHIWDEETTSINHLNRLISSQHSFDDNIEIKDIEKKLGITFNNGQRNAFNALKTSGIKILTGPPGSGKTAVINGLIEQFKENKNGVVKLAATTGMASKVMSKACKNEAETVNIMLNVRPFNDSLQGRDLNDPVDADLIIVDEVSMLGLQLFSILTRSIKSGSILLLVGDEDQLQSVDYGNILHDLIDCGLIEVYRLTEILRQSGTICDNAQKINQGLTNIITDDTFRIFNCNKNSEIVDLIQKKFTKDNSQILCPIKSGPLSTSTLNNLFQDQTAQLLATYGKKLFRLGDKIIMTKTNYDKGYINGDIGYVIGSNSDDTLTVRFTTKDMTIDKEDMSVMELADAITIHKSQGSEGDNIHIVLPKEASHMMTKRILYTAVTRAKKKVYIYNINKSLSDAIHDKAEKPRTTLLKNRIIASFS